MLMTEVRRESFCTGSEEEAGGRGPSPAQKGGEIGRGSPGGKLSEVIESEVSYLGKVERKKWRENYGRTWEDQNN